MVLRNAFRVLGLFVAVACAGCAHTIKIVPDQTVLTPHPEAEAIDKRVGYFISAENLAKVVTTSAGGGDRVKYLPYTDIETGFSRVLSNVFMEVVAVKDINDINFTWENKIDIVFVPVIETESWSRNIFFWPPTDFSVTIQCVALDRNGTEIWETSVHADGGLIAVSVILGEHGLAGRRATENALQKLQLELEKASELR